MKYTPDPMADLNEYEYDFEKTEKAYDARMADATRRYFTILHNECAIGMIYLKHMNIDERITSFGVGLSNDSDKGKGLGTEAICLLIEYAFEEMGFETIVADVVLRNTRSQHVLLKLGFVYVREDDEFKYYQLLPQNRVPVKTG